MPTMPRPQKASDLLHKQILKDTKKIKRAENDKSFISASDARPNPRTAGYVR